MPDGRAGGSGGEGGGADAARAESARQALLLATQTLGVNAADVQAARAERDAARASMEWLADELLKDRSREKVLEDAVREGHDEAVGCMLRRGADPNASDPRPLMIAAEYGNVRCLALLLKAGADAQYRSQDALTLGMTALHRAAGPVCRGHGKAECVRLLLEAGADPHAIEDFGETPLHAATNEGCCLDTIKLLLEAGADPNGVGRAGVTTPSRIASFHGNTPLLGASAVGRADCVKALLKAGALPDFGDNDGYTPLYVASSYGHAECVKLLLEAGADKDRAHGEACYDDGVYYPIHAASRTNEIECLKLLLEAGADANSVTSVGNTALHVATKRGHVGCVELLLEAGTDKDRANEDGQTPLHIAAEKMTPQHIDCLDALLDAGADASLCDKGGRTALDLARRAKNTAAIEAITAHVD